MEPLVLQIKRAVEAAVGVPVRVQQQPDDTFELIFLDNQTADPLTVED